MYILCVFRPEWGPGGERTTMWQKIKAIPGAFEMIVLFTLVMVGLYSGTYTPTEAGAAGAFFALVLGLIRRKLTFKGFIASVVDTLKVTSMIILIVTGAVILGRFLTISRMPFEVADYIAALPVQPWVIIIAILFIYMIAGMVMDALGFLLVSIPIFFPCCHEDGIRPHMVRVHPLRGDHHGSCHSSCRHLCVRGGWNGQGNSSGNSAQREYVGFSLPTGLCCSLCSSIPR